MPVNTRTIRRRIKSVQNTKKITKAMEMVAAVKMRRAVQSVSATRAYANLAWETVNRLKDAANPKLHRLLEVRDIKKAGVVVMSSNRGLCGGFNTHILVESLKLKEEYKDKELVFITYGKKVRDALRRRGGMIEADFKKEDITRRIEEISSLSRLIIDGFIDEVYDAVILVYMDFKSAMSQRVVAKQLLPIKHFEEDRDIGLTDYGLQVTGSKLQPDVIFEPSGAYILNTMLPRLIEMQIYQAVLETEASEHSSRMAAMKNASEAAGEMIEELDLAYNQARQANITKEISEIVGGKAALE